MRIRRVGATALLLEVDDPAAWFVELSRRRDAGELAAVEIVPGARTVLLDGLTDATGLTDRLSAWAPALEPPGVPALGPPGPPALGLPGPPALGLPGASPAGPATVGGRLVEIPVRYDGADLAYVAEQWSSSPAGVAELLGGTELRVAFCGFAPGFGYLTGLPASHAVPRLGTPRPQVPAGSVALAGEYVGIYPNASPGGWRLVGHTGVRLFNVDAQPPALLTPGTRVRFVEERP